MKKKCKLFFIMAFLVVFNNCQNVEIDEQSIELEDQGFFVGPHYRDDYPEMEFYLVQMDNGMYFLNCGDIYILDDDIIFTKEDLDQYLKPGTRGILAATSWPHGFVPYEIPATISQINRERILEAMRQWQKNANIYFYPRTGNEKGYMSFMDNVGVNSAPLGFGFSKRTVKLYSTEAGTGTIIHEIGHILGLGHEQSRPDRDKYLEIKWENIEAGKAHNFQEHQGAVSGPYTGIDYGSIMLYHSHAFSKNGQPTIVRKDGQTFSSQRDTLSRYDGMAVNRGYYGVKPKVTINCAPVHSMMRVATEYKFTGLYSEDVNIDLRGDWKIENLDGVQNSYTILENISGTLRIKFIKPGKYRITNTTKPNKKSIPHAEGDPVMTTEKDIIIYQEFPTPIITGPNEIQENEIGIFKLTNLPDQKYISRIEWHIYTAGGGPGTNTIKAIKDNSRTVEVVCNVPWKRGIQATVYYTDAVTVKSTKIFEVIGADDNIYNLSQVQMIVEPDHKYFSWSEEIKITLDPTGILDRETIEEVLFKMDLDEGDFDRGTQFPIDIMTTTFKILPRRVMGNDIGGITKLNVTATVTFKKRNGEVVNDSKKSSYIFFTGQPAIRINSDLVINNLCVLSPYIGRTKLEYGTISPNTYSSAILYKNGPVRPQLMISPNSYDLTSRFTQSGEYKFAIEISGNGKTHEGDTTIFVGPFSPEVKQITPINGYGYGLEVKMPNPWLNDCEFTLSIDNQINPFSEIYFTDTQTWDMNTDRPYTVRKYFFKYRTGTKLPAKTLLSIHGIKDNIKSLETIWEITNFEIPKEM